MDQPRARGAVNLSAKPSPRGTVLSRLRQSGSLKLLFPRPTPPELQAVLVNTAGGITGGDAFTVEARAEPGTHLTLTTQTAERAYRAQPGQVGSLNTRIFVGEGARLNWLPQETILFDGCALNRSLSIEMAKGASLLMVEPLVFGRTFMNETLRCAHLSDRIEIRDQDRPIYVDRMVLDGDVAAHLARPTIANGATAMASLVYLAPDAESHLKPVRALVPESAGASLLGKNQLAMRILAPDSHVLRQSLIPVLNRLTGNAIPRTWMT